MNDIKTNPKGRTRVYACGGASINIVGDINTLQINPDLLSDFDITQLDTSFSNLTPTSNNVENYLLPKVASVDGGGKNQDENKALIEEHIKPIMKQHPPRDVNIVMSTGSGSSGAVFATRIVNELLARGEIAIVLVIGTTGSRIEADNSLKTLKNYRAIAKARNAPVILSYLQNSPTMPRDKVNSHMLSTISYIGMLFSRRNKGLDTMDLRNWAYFTRPEVSKGLAAQVYVLTILLRKNTPEGEEAFTADLDKLGNILSVATLARQGANPELPGGYMPEYHAEGFVPDLKDSAKMDDHTVNYLIGDGMFEQFIASLLAFSTAEKPVVTQTSLLDNADVEADQF